MCEKECVGEWCVRRCEGEGCVYVRAGEWCVRRSVWESGVCEGVCGKRGCESVFCEHHVLVCVVNTELINT